MIKAMLTPWKAIVRNTAGMSAVEFSLILPFVIALLFGGYDLTTGINADRKVTAVARTIADLTAQYGSATENDIPKGELTKLIFPIGEAVLAPHDKSQVKMVISAVRIDANRNVSIDWSISSTGNSADEKKTIVLNDNLRIASTNLIWAEVVYTYDPLFGASIVGKIPLTENMFMRPRQNTCLKLAGKGCAAM